MFAQYTILYLSFISQNREKDKKIKKKQNGIRGGVATQGCSQHGSSYTSSISDLNSLALPPLSLPSPL
jgi:hypothetical protein